MLNFYSSLADVFSLAFEISQLEILLNKQQKINKIHKKCVQIVVQCQHKYAIGHSATRRYSTLLDASRRYSTLLDATRRYSTLLDATRRFLTLLDATRRYSSLL
jgi:hypothetical protein